MDDYIINQDDLECLIGKGSPLQDIQYMIDEVRTTLSKGKKFIIEQRYINAPTEIVRVISTETELVKWIQELKRLSGQDIK